MLIYRYNGQPHSTPDNILPPWRILQQQRQKNRKKSWQRDRHICMQLRLL